MAQTSLKKQALSGMLWSGIQRFGTLGIAFISNLVLVRFLDAEVFGAIGILLVFVAISQSIIDGGFTSALIQRKDASQTDYSTVFFWNLGVSAVMVILLYLSAPAIANYFHSPILSKVLRVQSVLLIIHAMCVVQSAKLTKSLSFKALSIRSVTANFAGAVVAIVMAYKGYGIWSVVTQELVAATVGSILLWVLCGWTPSLTFSWKSFKGMFKFGGFIFLSSIVETLYTNVQSFIIGRAFSISDLGYYTQAKKLENVPVSSASTMLAQVLFPVYSSISDDYNRLKGMVRRNMAMVTYISFPAMLLLAILARPILVILYTDKWLASIPMFQILCLGGMFHAINVCNTMLFKALGYGGVYFVLQTVKRVVCLVFILFSIQFGLYPMLWTIAAALLISYVINVIYTHKYFRYTISEQLSDIMPNLILSLLVGAALWYAMDYISVESNIVNILMGIGIYSVLYLGVSAAFKFKSLKYLLSIWK